MKPTSLPVVQPEEDMECGRCIHLHIRNSNTLDWDCKKFKQVIESTRNPRRFAKCLNEKGKETFV